MPGFVEPAVPPARPTMPLFKVEVANIADGVVPIFDDEDVAFTNLQLKAEKAVGTDNAADIEIHIRQPDGTYAKDRVMEPGISLNWPAPPNGGPWNKDSFKFKVAADGDGVHATIG